MAASIAPTKHIPGLEPQRGPRTDNDLSEAARNALVESCMNLCRKLARQAVADVVNADIADLEGEAFLACCQAAKAYRPDGVGVEFCAESAAKFATFAHPYITKRLRGLSQDQRRLAAMARPEKWEIVPESEAVDSEEPIEPDDEARELLAKIPEPSRTAARLVVFERRSPDQVAEQLGIPVKDVKLVLRNAAKELQREKRRLAHPGLFGFRAGELEFVGARPTPVLAG